MISNEQLEDYLRVCPDIEYVSVSGDGHHYQVTLVSDVFEGKTRLARQRWVYEKLNHFIVSGELHAINMITWSNTEWEKHRG